jgi:hypothetical protein
MPEAVALVMHAPDPDPRVGQAGAAMDYEAETAVEGAEDHPLTAVVVEERLHGMGPRTCQLARRGIAISVPCRRSSRREPGEVSRLPPSRDGPNHREAPGVSR